MVQIHLYSKGSQVVYRSAIPAKMEPPIVIIWCDTAYTIATDESDVFSRMLDKSLLIYKEVSSFKLL